MFLDFKLSADTQNSLIFQFFKRIIFERQDGSGARTKILTV